MSKDVKREGRSWEINPGLFFAIRPFWQHLMLNISFVKSPVGSP